MASAEQRAAYNREYYARVKAYRNAHPESTRTKRFKEKSRDKSRATFRKNIERYSEEQSVIQTARKARGWTQKQLGDMLGVSLQYVSHWEHGRSKAPWDKLYEVMPELKEARE